MSKTAQRKRSAYSLGYEDAYTGRPHKTRWLCPQTISRYDSGYQAGKRAIMAEQKKTAKSHRPWKLCIWGFSLTLFALALIWGGLRK